MSRVETMWLLLAMAAGLAPLTSAAWIIPPTALNNPYGAHGPDGVPNTADDPPLEGFGIPDYYAGHDYLDLAAVNLNGDVILSSGDVFEYTCTIMNNGMDPFETYSSTGNGPNFLQVPSLLDTSGDVAPETEVDTRNGGVPSLKNRRH